MASPDPPAPRGMTRDDFATLVTHELRNSLNAMSGWLQLLQLDATPRGDAARQALAGLRSAVDHQLAQVEVLGGVLRMAGGRAPAARAPIALEALLREVAGVLRGADGAAPARPVLLRLDAVPGEPHGKLTLPQQRYLLVQLRKIKEPSPQLAQLLARHQ